MGLTVSKPPCVTLYSRLSRRLDVQRPLGYIICIVYKTRIEISRNLFVGILKMCASYLDLTIIENTDKIVTTVEHLSQ